MEQEKPEVLLTNQASSEEIGEDADLRTHLLTLAQGFQVTETIYAAVQLNLAGHLDDQERVDEDLAQVTGVNPQSLYRLLRALAAIGIVNETASHRFALTPMGRLLKKDVPRSIYNTVLFWGSKRASGNWHELLFSVRTGEPATEYLFGITTWEYYAKNPEEAPLFYNFITEASNRLAQDVAAKYNFSGLKVVADIGGAQGNIVANILKQHSFLKGILFDLPNVVPAAKIFLEKQGVAARCQVVAGDMFQPWPIQADLYLISRVIHDWKDEQAITILKNCRKAMDENSKLVLLERTLPSDQEGSLLFYLSDLNMLVGPGGQERTLEEFRQLFQAAGLRFTRTIPLNTAFSLFEAEIAPV